MVKVFVLLIVFKGGLPGETVKEVWRSHQRPRSRPVPRLQTSSSAQFGQAGKADARLCPDRTVEEHVCALPS